MALTKTWPASSSRTKRSRSRVVVRPDARAEAEGRVVGQPDRLVGRRHAEERRDRAEELLAVRRRVARDVDEHRRREVVARARASRAAREHARTGGDRRAT